MTRTTEHTSSAREPLVAERIPAQRGSVSRASVLHGHTVLLADPSHTRRGSLSAEL